MLLMLLCYFMMYGIMSNNDELYDYSLIINWRFWDLEIGDFDNRLYDGTIVLMWAEYSVNVYFVEYFRTKVFK